MVLYYSATGNTEYIAKRIAKRLDDECLDLLARIKANDYSELHSEKPFVICAPVYVAEMPVFLRDYLKKVSLTGTKDVYSIFTSGGYAGISGMLAKYLVQKIRNKIILGVGELETYMLHFQQGEIPVVGECTG